MIFPARLSPDMQKEYLLCFIHIPKTAGTSFTDMLFKLIGVDKFQIVLPEILDGLKEPDFDVNNFKGVSGHFPYEITKLISKPAIFLTFLRDPLSRSLSHFNQFQRINLDDPWIRKRRNYKDYKKVLQMSFEDFVEHPFFRGEISNLQTRMLGLLINRPIHHLNELKPMNIADDRFFSVELAKERLEKLSFFGLQERFQESINIFSYQFGTHPFTNPPNLNVSYTNQLSAISEQVTEKLLQLNKLDVELYEFAQKLFTKRHNEMLSTLHNVDQQIDTSSLFEILPIELYEKDKIEIFPYHFEFEERYIGPGRYPVERVNEKTWVWSGPETTSVINLPISRIENLRIQFQVLHFIEFNTLEKLELRIDDQLIHLTHILDKNIHNFTGIIPLNPQKEESFTRLSFHINSTAYPPGMTAESPGACLLGMALSRIEILAEKDFFGQI